MLRWKLVIAAFSCFIGCCLSAQPSHSSFTDSWVLFDQVAIARPLYSNALPQMTSIDASSDRVYFRELTTNSRGVDTTLLDTCLFNQIYTVQYRADRYKEVQSKWLEGNQAFEVTTLIYPSPAKAQLLFRIKETYSLHGKQLFLEEQFENLVNKISFACKGIYERREERE